MAITMINLSTKSYGIGGKMFNYKSPPVAGGEPPGPDPGGPITYTDGYGGDVFTAWDNILNGNTPVTKTLNLGVHENAECSPTQNFLVLFDLSAIPSTATCLSATLYLYKSYPVGEGGGSPTIRAYLITAANAGWIAGTGSLDVALEDESCWDALGADGASGIKTAWAGGANGCGVSSVDISSLAIGDIYIPNAVNEVYGTEYQITLDTTFVKLWFGETNQNYGLNLKTSGGGDHYGTANHSDTTVRPKLVVTYEV